MNRSTCVTLTAVSLAILSGPAFAFQEDKAEATKPVEAGGIAFEVPEAWEVNVPQSQMRVLEITIPASEEGGKPADLVLYRFPGGAGTVKMNVDRWQQQFIGEDGKFPEIETETIEADGAEITMVETSGRYVTQIPEPVDEANYRLLGGIYPTDAIGYFFKLVGPDATVKAAKPAFSAMLKSVKPD